MRRPKIADVRASVHSLSCEGLHRCEREAARLSSSSATPHIIHVSVFRQHLRTNSRLLSGEMRSWRWRLCQAR
jgi:hypothetical protein